MRLSNSLLMLAFLASGSVVAQQPVMAPMPVPEVPSPGSPLASGVTQPAPIPEATAGLTEEMSALGAMRRSVESKRLILQQKQLDQQIGETAADSGEARGKAYLPELVGITAARGRQTAEFLVGQALLNARPGDWITPEWRLLAIHRNGVEVKGPEGRHTLLFGHQPPRGALSGMQASSGGRASAMPPPVSAVVPADLSTPARTTFNPNAR